MGYVIPEHRKDALRVEVDAIHAPTLLLTVGYAQRIMGTMNMSKEALGIILAESSFTMGVTDRLAPIVRTAESISDFGSKLTLPESRVILSALRTELSGNIRTMMSAAAADQGARWIELVLYEGGAILVLPGEEKDDSVPATIFATGAGTLDEERKCVVANRDSRSAYRMLWNALDETRTAERERQARADRDVLEVESEDVGELLRRADAAAAGSGVDDEDMIDFDGM